MGEFRAYISGGLSFGATALGVRGPTNILGLTAEKKNITIAGIETYTYQPSAVPTPATVWLFGTALISLFGFKRNKLAA